MYVCPYFFVSSNLYEIVCKEICPLKLNFVRWPHTPNANMAESNGSEASEALRFCFDNALPEDRC